ncbi:Ribonuclease H2 subunit A [Yarrowia sp. C11]|nr:Ribonuclease H2 subunit A [Yarrowia sp. E02]KAG5367734.1 Ribonuclease H2 subunit A [Yarrowia sp. C11]
MTVETAFEEFVPPSVLVKKSHTTHTHYSAVPNGVSRDPHKPCILGVDEAGRGPVLGSMVYGLAYCTKEFADQELSKTGFADSKTLTAEKRSSLMREICCDETLVENLGWCTTSMTAQDISSAMLRPMARGVYNLNDQAHDTTMALIQGVLDRGVLLTEAYIDTVGPPASYSAKLSKQFPHIKFTVTKKADSLFPIVSAASICAKVTRDMDLKSHDLSEGTWGSGYPSDPKTSVWLKSHVDQVFGWMPVVRFSWQTAKDLVEKEEKGGVECVWADDLKRDSKSVEAYFRAAAKEKTKSKLVISSEWYGASVGSDVF